MATPDSVNTFIDEVCKYMQTWNSYANAVDGRITLDRACSEPYADFKKKLKLFYMAFDPLHRVWHDQFFTKVPFDRNAVMTLLDRHCFKVKSRSKNIFVCILYIFSYTYSLLLYCERRNLNNMLSQIPTILIERFTLLEPKFIEEGRWRGLEKFCSSQNLHVLLQFITHTYCEEAIFHTFVQHNGFFDFGLHGKETLALLLTNLDDFESSVREAFNSAINADTIYRIQVDHAFHELRHSLHNGPLQNFLSTDRVNLAANPTSPLSQI